MKVISWQEFEQVEIRTGTIVEVLDFPEAKKPAYRLRIDFGAELGIKKSSAQITALYNKASLVGKQIVAVVNFAPKQIGPWMSECLVLGVSSEEGIVLLSLDQAADNGQKVH
jgi:tRNA-binding protein